MFHMIKAIAFTVFVFGASCTSFFDTTIPILICCEADGYCYLPQEYSCGGPDTGSMSDVDAGDVPDTGLADATDTELDPPVEEVADGDVPDTSDEAEGDTTPPIWRDINVPEIDETAPGQYVILLAENDRGELRDPYLYQLVEEEWLELRDEGGEKILVGEPFSADLYLGTRIRIFEDPLQRLHNPCNKVGIALPPCDDGEVCIIHFPRYVLWYFEEYGMKLSMAGSDRISIRPTLQCINDVLEELPVAAEDYCPTTSSVFWTDNWGYICAETGYLKAEEEPGPISQCASQHPDCDRWFTSDYGEDGQPDFDIVGVKFIEGGGEIPFLGSGQFNE